MIVILDLLLFTKFIYHSTIYDVIYNMSLARTVKWIDKTEGRDKFCKAIQYACRFLKHRFELQDNKEAAAKFDSLFGNMRDARKLFRLFKTVNEIKKIQDLLKKDPTADNIINVAVRFFFGLYWVFDNLNILSKVKILGQDPKQMAKIGSTFWLLALVANLVLLLKNLADNFKEVDKIRKYSAMTDQEAKDRKKKLGELAAARTKTYLGLAKVLGDIIPAGHGSEFFQNVLGFTANDTWCGLGGLISSVIASYELYD